MAGTPLLIVDAFASRPFTGNPAAVCLLDDERPREWMQALGAEMNLSETAFVRKLDDVFELRWFTPAIEVDLCGHATLAAAHALWETGRAAESAPIRFSTRSGILTARRRDGLIELDFPATPVEPAEVPANVLEALGAKISFGGRSKFDLFLVVASADELRGLQPDFVKLTQAAARGVLVTCASDDPRYDFLSRFFAPGAGINEDPVTGSAHCALAPYWGERLQKRVMMGYQVSARGGEVRVELAGERVLLGGRAATVVKGELTQA